MNASRVVCAAVAVLSVVLAVALFRPGAASDAADLATASFDPFRFFEGRATSRGSITTLLGGKTDFTAGFSGSVGPDGVLLLDERFRFPDGDPLQRWRLRRAGGGRIVGTVETAGGNGRLHAPVPVEGTLGADGLRLRYRGYAPGGDRELGFRHHMTGQGDGTVLNRVSIRAFGLPVAHARVVFARTATDGRP